MGDPPNPLGVMFKVVMYMFDLISDWTNGVLLLMPKNGTAASYNKSDVGNSCHQVELEVHPAWGSLSIALSWVPALAGLFFLVKSATDWDSTIWRWIFLPLRFVLWPLIVPILM